MLVYLLLENLKIPCETEVGFESPKFTVSFMYF